MGLLDQIRRSMGSARTGSVNEPHQNGPGQGPQLAVKPSPAHTGAEVAPAAPSTAVPADRTHLGTWLDVSVADLAGLSDAVERIYDGSLDGLTIRGVFTPEEVATGVARAREHADEFRDHGKQIMFGTALVGADDTRTGYYADAPVINDRIEELFDVDFVQRVAGVVSACAGGRPATVPEEEGRGSYVPATIRFLPPGRGVMHAHTANEFCNAWEAYSHLREIARMWNSLSYFVVGQAPDSGGELVLYDLMWDDTPDDVRALGMSEERDDLLTRFDTRPIRLGAGDMILFTGGRIWHRVAPVDGSQERVTIGGFVALSTDDEQVYFWS